MRANLLQRGLEWGAVIAGLVYTILLIQQNIWSWPFAILSSSLFFLLVSRRGLYAEAALHLFYIGMAVYGWYFFNKPAVREAWDFSLQAHLLFITILWAAAFGLGYLLKTYTKASLPFLDSFTTVFSMGATLLMVNLILENWLYFIGINLLSVWLYAARKLWISAGLMLVYAVLAFMGYFSWA